ncbi:MAG: hypothetical protein IPM91_03365 [Bacteroidetes bacterium]|nr:hypothetical protein [Bacteroidota bacterium]
MGVSSISDSNGVVCYVYRKDLLIPVNGIVINRYHLMMENGNSIYGVGWYHDRIIIPNPSNDSLLYIFSAGVTAVVLMDFIFHRKTTKPITIAALSSKKCNAE